MTSLRMLWGWVGIGVWRMNERLDGAGLSRSNVAVCVERQ